MKLVILIVIDLDSPWWHVDDDHTVNIENNNDYSEPMNLEIDISVIRMEP